MKNDRKKFDECRKRLIEDIHYDKLKIEEYSWSEIAELYGYVDISNRENGKKYANKHYNWYKKIGFFRNEYSPGNNFDDDEVPNLTLRSRWQVQTKGGGTKWLESYRNNITQEDLIDFKKSLIKDISKYSINLPDFSTVQKTDNIVYVISFPDLHFGKQSIEQTKKEFIDCFLDLVDRVPTEKVSQYILPIGNDLFQTEGMRRTSTRGTSLEDFSEWKSCFREVWKTVSDMICYLAEFSPVYVPIVQGNHDWERTFYLGEVISGIFNGNERVTIDNQYEPRKYYSFGKVFLGWDHGNDIKPTDYPLIMATEKPNMFAEATTRIMFTGHLHSQQNYEIRGVHVRFLPSICPADEWHKRKGYDSQRAAQGYKFDQNGLIGYEESRI